MRTGWETYEYRGTNASTWEEIKEAARDAWERVTGKKREEAGSTQRRK